MGLLPQIQTEFFAILEALLLRLDNEFGKDCVSILRSDNAKVFKEAIVQLLCQRRGIVQQFSAPYRFLCWGGSSIEQPFQLLVVDFSWIIGYFTRSAFTIRAIGGSEFYRIFLSDHPLIYSEHQVSVERKSDLVRTSTIGYPGPVVRVGLHDS